jgi:hypothetical protein
MVRVRYDGLHVSWEFKIHKFHKINKIVILFFNQFDKTFTIHVSLKLILILISVSWLFFKYPKFEKTDNLQKYGCRFDQLKQEWYKII